jgi:hypothetical protein
MARTVEEMGEFMESQRDEYIKFDRVKYRLSDRPDLHAFLLLDKLAPPEGGGDMIEASEHDEFWLSADPKRVAEAATDENLIDLVRCGVLFHDAAFSMFA